MSIRPVNMEFLYGTSFLSQSPEAYERLILDAMRGEATLFTRNDEVEAQWRDLRPDRRDVGGRRRGRCRKYEAGSQGPARGRRLLLEGHRVAGDLMRGDAVPAVSDAVWSAQDTTPDEIEAALRELLIERHDENDGYVPARVLNMIAFVEHEWSGEIANRLRGVGRYHASRTIVSPHEPRRERLDAVASVASDADPAPGELALMHETVIVELGDRHLDDLATIADPLVVTDLPTLLWAPHGHREAVEALLALAQACCSTRSRSRCGARARPRVAAARRALRRRPRLAALDALARADRHAPSTRRARARSSAAQRGDASATIPSRGRRDAARRLAGLAAGLAARELEIDSTAAC